MDKVAIRLKHKKYFNSNYKPKSFNACSKCQEATKNKFGTTEYKYLCDVCFKQIIKKDTEIKYNGKVLIL